MGAAHVTEPEIPVPGRVLVSAEDLENRVAELGARITADYEGKSPLLVGVLKGAFMFMSCLLYTSDAADE